jgi:hypothetical protein
MCNTRAAAARQRSAAAAALVAAAPCAEPLLTPTKAAHSDAYERGGALEPTLDEAEAPVRRLPLSELAADPAVLTFVAMHVLALATPWLVGGVTWRTAALVAASYTARMFGARAARGRAAPAPRRMCSAAAAARVEPAPLTRRAARARAGITCGFHRLLSHRSFQTSRPVQARRARVGRGQGSPPLWRCGGTRARPPARQPGRPAPALPARGTTRLEA